MILKIYFEGGNLYVEVRGCGEGILPGFNNVVGKALFNSTVEGAIEKFGIR